MDSYDWAIEVLDRRIDGPAQGTSLVATPAGVRCEGALAAGTALRAVSRSHDDASVGRVALDVTLVTDALVRSFGDFTLPGSSFSDGPYVVVAPARAEPGDSGSPIFVGDPDTGPLTLISVLSGLYASPTYDPRVRDWLCPLLDPGATFHGVYVGPADFPVRGAPGRLAWMDSPDPDGDGLEGSHDVCPDDFDPDQLDADRDGVGDPCDACPGVTGGGTNRDGDAFGDSCDLCPDLASTNADLDLDGIGNECDNCSAIANRLQEDCNIDATLEVRRRQTAAGMPLTPFRGDVCDPTPCGDTRPTTRVERVGRARRLRADRIEVDGRVSPASTTGGTGMRFCACDLATRDTLEEREQCRQSTAGRLACGISVPGEYDRSRETGALEGLAWRWITTAVGGAASSTTTEATVPYQRPFEGAFVPDATYSHELEATDVPRWLATPALAASYPRTTIEAHTLRGVLWTHTRTLSVLPGRPPTPLADDIRLLSSHYWSGVSPDSFTTPEPPPPCLRPFGPLTGDASCPFCGTFFPELYVGNYSLLPSRRCSDAVGALVGIDYGGFRIALPPAGLDLPIVDPRPLALDGVRWVAAVEPAQVLPADGLRWIGLDAANVVSALVFSSAQGLSVINPAQSACPSPNNPSCEGPFRLAARTTQLGPIEEPVTYPDTAWVLSGARQTLFAIGGTQEDGNLRSAIDIYSIEGRHWQVLADTGEVPLGRMLGATFAEHDDRLYVLDEVEAPRATRIRLLRIDPNTGARVVVVQFPRLARADSYAMAADAAGRLYVAASFERGDSGRGAHVVLQLSRDGVALGLAAGAGVLVGAPMHASEPGLSVLVTGAESPTVIGYRWTDFRGGRGLVDRCF